MILFTKIYSHIIGILYIICIQYVCMLIINRPYVYEWTGRVYTYYNIVLYTYTRDAAKREMFIIACYTRAFLEFSSPVAPAAAIV